MTQKSCFESLFTYDTIAQSSDHIASPGRTQIKIFKLGRKHRLTQHISMAEKGKSTAKDWLGSHRIGTPDEYSQASFFVIDQTKQISLRTFDVLWITGKCEYLAECLKTKCRALSSVYVAHLFLSLDQEVRKHFLGIRRL